MNNEFIITANQIKVGTQLAEADGFLFDVTEIVKETPKTITVRLCSDFSSFNGSLSFIFMSFSKKNKKSFYQIKLFVNRCF